MRPRRPWWIGTDHEVPGDYEEWQEELERWEAEEADRRDEDDSEE